MPAPLIAALHSISFPVHPGGTDALAGLLGYEPRGDGTLAAPGSEWGRLYPVETVSARGAAPLDGTLPRGWAAAEIVVRDVDDTVSRSPFPVVREPVTTDLRAEGSLLHRSAVIAVPFHLMLTEPKTQPHGRTFPSPGAIAGPVFAAHLRGSGPAAGQLYQEVLGMVAFLDLAWTDGWWHDYWGLPTGTDVEVRLLKGDAPGTGLGTVELQRYPEHVLTDAPGATVAFTSSQPETAGQRARASGYAVETMSEGIRITGDIGERLVIYADPPR